MRDNLIFLDHRHDVQLYRKPYPPTPSCCLYLITVIAGQ
jgi:hypothetical protein